MENPQGSSKTSECPVAIAWMKKGAAWKLIPDLFWQVTGSSKNVLHCFITWFLSEGLGKEEDVSLYTFSSFWKPVGVVLPKGISEQSSGATSQWTVSLNGLMAKVTAHCFVTSIRFPISLIQLKW